MRLELPPIKFSLYGLILRLTKVIDIDLDIPSLIEIVGAITNDLY